MAHLLAAAACAAAPSFRVVAHVSLATDLSSTGFISLHPLTLVDRERQVTLGRPFGDRQGLTLLDLDTLAVHVERIPDWPGKRFPAKDAFDPDRPLFYDRANGSAAVLLRRNASVRDDAIYLEWNPDTHRITRSLLLARGAGAYWTDVRPIGYDPVRRACYLEICRCRGGGGLPCQPGGPYDTEIVAVTDAVRSIASWSGPLKYTTKDPIYDPLHHRSMHIEYAECGEEQTAAHLVDLDTGAVKDFPLPRVIYGFAFDPDGRTGYVYSHALGSVFTLDLVTGARGPAVRFGKFAHLLAWIGPGVLALGRDTSIDLIEAATLRLAGAVTPAAFHPGPTHLEGSIFMPGRALVRVYSDLYVLDFPGLGNR